MTDYNIAKHDGNYREYKHNHRYDLVDFNIQLLLLGVYFGWFCCGFLFSYLKGGIRDHAWLFVGELFMF